MVLYHHYKRYFLDTNIEYLVMTILYDRPSTCSLPAARTRRSISSLACAHGPKTPIGPSSAQARNRMPLWIDISFCEVNCRSTSSPSPCGACRTTTIDSRRLVLSAYIVLFFCFTIYYRAGGGGDQTCVEAELSREAEKPNFKPGSGQAEKRN